MMASIARRSRTGGVAGLLLVAATAATAAAPARSAIGSWATYRWTSSLRQEVPVLVRQVGPGGQVTWSVAREASAPEPVFVTYAVVAADARSYTLQIVTQEKLDGPPLSVTQVRVDRATGKALRSVIRTPKGVVATPESGLRPLDPGDVKGTEESVTVPAGEFAAVRAQHRDGTVWVSDRVPATGIVKAAFSSGTMELVRSGTAGAKDLLRS